MSPKRFAGWLFLRTVRGWIYGIPGAERRAIYWVESWIY